MDAYAQLYGKLRAAVLARHFATNKLFRTNFLNMDNVLKAELWAEELLRHGPDIQQEERWSVHEHYDMENPLMWSGQLLTCLYPFGGV